MARVLLLIIIALLILASFRGFFRSATRTNSTPRPKSDGGEDMVACARCGVNLPTSEAVFEAGKFHCKDNPRCRP